MPDQLPDFVLADLFPSNLVIIESGKSSVLNAATPTTSDSLTAVETPIQTNAQTVEKIIAKEKIKTISPESSPSHTEQSEKPEKWYLGNNAKNCTILVYETNAAFLNEASLEFLTKILGACKLNMGDVAVINMARYQAHFAEIKKELNPSTCLLFNVTTASIKLPFIIPPYQVQQFDQCKFLIAPALANYYEENAEAKLEKTKLWVSLKSLFNI
ncbi:hypothetical protein [Sediminibacterium sp.]|uniref:hypothetical protein n=1 Tax=Sediminibacterium sp. TaxID=1917865 RepID=UPI003F6E7FD1